MNLFCHRHARLYDGSSFYSVVALSLYMVQGLGFARFGRPNRVSRRRLRRLARIRYCSPKGPCTPILCGLAPKCQHGDYFKAKVPRNLLSCILVRGVVPYADFSDVSMPIRHESCIPFLLPGACLLSLMGRKTTMLCRGSSGVVWEVLAPCRAYGIWMSEARKIQGVRCSG